TNVGRQAKPRSRLPFVPTARTLNGVLALVGLLLIAVALLRVLDLFHQFGRHRPRTFALRLGPGGAAQEVPPAGRGQFHWRAAFGARFFHLHGGQLLLGRRGRQAVL